MSEGQCLESADAQTMEAAPQGRERRKGRRGLSGTFRIWGYCNRRFNGVARGRVRIMEFVAPSSSLSKHRHAGQPEPDMPPNTKDQTPIAIALAAMRMAHQDLAFLGGCTHTDRPDLPLSPDTSWTTDVASTLAALDAAGAALNAVASNGIGGCCGCRSSLPSAPGTDLATLPAAH